MDRIEGMRAFVTVVSEGGFTRAAERMDQSPQLVSKYVSQLEQHLGARLLNRTTRKTSLTELGTRYFEHAKQILADIDDMESQLGDFGQTARGTLRISAPMSFAIKHMAKLVHDFQTLYPAVNIDLQLNDRKVDIVEEGFDIALRIGHLKNSSLIAKFITPIRLALCASPEYLEKFGTPERPEDLQNHRYLHYSYMETESQEGIHRWLLSGKESTGNLVSNNGDVLVEAAIAGAGIAIQPTFISGGALASGKLVQILRDYAPEPLGLYAVYPHRKLMASKVRCFIDFIDGYFGTPPYWDSFDEN